MFKRLSLGAKLSIAFIVMTALVAGVGLYQVRSISEIGQLFTDLTTYDFKRNNALGNIKMTAQQVENVVFHHSDQRLQAGNWEDDLNTSEKTFNELLEQYESHLEGEALEAITPAMRNALREDFSKLLLAAQQYITASQSSAQISSYHAGLESATAQFNQSVNKIIEVEDTHTNLELTKTSDAVARLIQIILLMIGGVAVFSTLLGVAGVTMLNNSLRRLKQGAQRIANGDFSKRLPTTSHDEMGQVTEAFNNMATRLRDSYHRLSIETERNKILLESLGEGVIAVDEKARIVLINEPAKAIFELSAEETIVGQPVDKAVAIKDVKGKVLADNTIPLIEVLRTSIPLHDTYGFQKKAGANIMIDVIANPVIVEGKTVAVIMNIRDVTKEREIDRMKTEFISLASHQLRTPLSAIRWFSEMLLSGDAGELKPDQAEFARNISDSTDRMIALVNALLNISRIESGRILIDPKPTDLRELVSGIVNDLKAKTSEKEQTLIISVHQDLPKINLDPRLISQVYLNLLTNAIKYTPKGGEISVFISRKDDNVVSQVTDNGYGIPKEQQGRIFQKFFRATNAAKIETDGTGLGLYLIKAVVESSGGKIWFESEEGKGTTFWFSIPLSGMKAKEGEVTLDA